jgi:hypothetical protein
VPPAPSTRFERACALSAWALPFAIALTRASSHAQWRGDVAAVRDVGLAGLGWGGGVSTALSQVALLLPLGSVTFRTALVSCLALAVAAQALFGLALSMLRAVEARGRDEPSEVAAPALAALATMLATMAPTFQSEGTVGGGVMVAAALCLAVIARTAAAAERARVENPHRGLVGSAFLLGAAIAENAVAGGVTALVLIVASLVAPSSAGTGKVWLIPSRVVRASGLAALAGLLVFSAPGLLRAMAPNTALDLGGPWLWGSLLPGAAAAKPTLVQAWTTELGVIAVGMAAFGVVTLALLRDTRVWLIAPLLVFTAELLLHSRVGATEGALGLRSLSLGLTACVSTVGVHAFFTRLTRLRVPLARAGAALVVAFTGTLVALTVEQSSEVADRDRARGAEELTDLAVERLPPRAAVLVSAPHLTWRLLAASLVEGRRPDVLLLTKSILHRGDAASRLMAREPSAEPLVRLFAIEGRTDEFSLNEIADARPLVVEPDLSWSDPEYAHLSIDGAWLRFQPEPLGKSDKRLDLPPTLARLARLFEAVAERPGDEDTAAAARALITAHAKGLLRANDVKGADAYLAAVDKPGTSITASSGSLEVAFAATLSHMPVNRAQKEREKEKAKIREIDRRAEEKKGRKKGAARPR